MPNSITSSGLATDSYADTLAAIINGLRQIYGPDINTDQDTPDGQLANIYTLSKQDLLDFLTQIYNGMSPSHATGRVLDQRCAYSGVFRRAGTRTQTIIEITTDRAVTLTGLDGGATSTSPFTVRDATGNQFQLINTFAATAAGTYQLQFQSTTLGNVQVAQNTLTTPVTILLGVTAANNPYAPYAQGIDEETDADLRVRRDLSVALPNQGFLDGLTAALLDTDGVTAAIVYENKTNTTDADGIPGHSIWVIVEGGDNNAIAQAIYTKLNAGCGIHSTNINPVTVNVPQVNGLTLAIVFNRPVSELLYIDLTLTTSGDVALDSTHIRDQLIDALNPGIYEKADTTTIAALVKQIEPHAVVVSAPLHTVAAPTPATMRFPHARQNKFSLTTDTVTVHYLPAEA